MNRHISVLLLTFIAGAASWAVAQDHYRNRPESASLSVESGGDCFTFGPCNLTVQNYDTNGSQTDYGRLYYTLALIDGTVVWGSGTIPKGAFFVDGENLRARLNVDTRTLAGFSAYTCVGFAPPPSPTCVPDGGVGLIAVEWTPNGVWEITNAGVQEQRFACCGSFVQRFRSVEATADANASIGAIPVVVTDAWVGTNRYFDRTSSE